jgi:hypothetical protein
VLAVSARGTRPCRAAGTHVATGEVASLEHEVGNDTVELGAGVSEALLARAEGAEVLYRLGHDVVEELKVDAARVCCDCVSTCLGASILQHRRVLCWSYTAGVHGGAGRLTLLSALGGDIARLVDLDVGALPGHVKVRFDGHVVCRRSEESLVERGAGNGCTRAEGREGRGTKWGEHFGGWRGGCVWSLSAKPMSSEVSFAGEARGAASWCHCSATICGRILGGKSVAAFLLVGNWCLEQHLL